MKLAVIYHSQTGNTKQAAEWIAEGMNRISGAEAKTFSIDDVDTAFVCEAKGVVIGCPSYMASMTPELRTWLMQGRKLKLAGKLGGAFATEQYTHGGGEMVIQSILTNELVFGMLCYSGGVSQGKPVIHMGPIGVNGNIEPHNDLNHYKGVFVLFGERFARKAAELFGGALTGTEDVTT
ncbi:MAG: flavodoxin family protein [Oscillospiraceae bacterium]|nr:flavodoxin family protein [Oscillospiraceae bacterium]